MFHSKIYTDRRKQLIENVKTGVILLFGNTEIPQNYPGNPYHFRQDSNFLYYVGIDQPDLICIIDCDNGRSTLYGDDISLEDSIWTGDQPSMVELADRAGIKNTKTNKDFTDDIKMHIRQNRNIHYLPPYPANRQVYLSELFQFSNNEARSNYSVSLIKAIIKQRSYKTTEEVKEIENTLDEVTGPMHKLAMQMAKKGVYEYEIAGQMESMASKHNMAMAYPTICSVRGEILHNYAKNNQLQEGQLLLIDAGAESNMHYATDITRTTPVNGTFTQQQKDIYEIVLAAETGSISAIKPGIAYREIHMQAAKIIFSGLKELGIVKGDEDEAVNLGALALFFPHGLGHMLGLDVHDMEDLGEDYVGYTNEIKRSNLFGTAYLRLGRKLEPGFVLTVEPGLYFISNLIEKWQAEKKFNSFINYDKLSDYKGFGGIRIEDNVLVTKESQKVLGKHIPKTISEIEELFKA